jgi:hypothetical protein
MFPFADKEIFFGPIMEDVDHSEFNSTLYQTVVWHAFCLLLHGRKVQADEAIFLDTSEIIKKAIEKRILPSKTTLAQALKLH